MRGLIVVLTITVVGLMSASPTSAQQTRIGSQRTDDVRQYIELLDRRLADGRPESAREWRDRIDTLREAGDLLVVWGDADRAMQRYQESVDLARDRSTNGLDATASQIGVAEGLKCMGALLVDLNDPVLGRRRFEEALLAIRDYAANDAPSALLASLISLSLGELLEAEDDMGRALQHYRESLAFYENLEGHRSWNANRAADINFRIGRVVFAQGDLPLARQIFEADLIVSRDLADSSPRLRTLFSGRLVRSLLWLGDVFAAQGDHDQAHARFQEALAVAEDRAADFRYPEIHRDLMIANARMFNVTGERRYLSRAREIARRLEASNFLRADDAEMIAAMRRRRNP